MVLEFTTKHYEMQQIAREIEALRKINQPGTLDAELRIFAEAALVTIALERFARIVLGPDADDKDTLPKLLETLETKHGILVPWDKQHDGRQKIRAVRNTMLHANYEQAAHEAGITVDEYFKTSQFVAEAEGLYRVLCYLVDQVDLDTGKKKTT